MAQGVVQSTGRGGGIVHATGEAGSGTLADLVERVLDKGVVIFGDIKINLADVELLTIKIRLLVASVETAQKIGIAWWETDGFDLSSKAKQLQEENRMLKERLDRIEAKVRAT